MYRGEMMKLFTFITLLIGTVLGLLFIYFLDKGKKYQGMIDILDSNDHSMKEFYPVGFMWSDLVSDLSYGGKLGMLVKPYNTILHGEKYTEFYSRVTLAKAYALMHFGLMIGALIGGVTRGLIPLIALGLGAGFGFYMAKDALDEPKNKVEKKAEDYMNQFPNIVSKLSLMINSGMILREAWFSAAKSSEGVLGDLMVKSCQLMENGRSDVEAVRWFGDNSGSNEIKKFSSALVQGMEKGNAELTEILSRQSSELWEVKRQRTLAKGEAAASKLLMPTALIFVGILIIILTSALSGTSL